MIVRFDLPAVQPRTRTYNNNNNNTIITHNNTTTTTTSDISSTNNDTTTTTDHDKNGNDVHKQDLPAVQVVRHERAMAAGSIRAAEQGRAKCSMIRIKALHV